MYIASLAFHNMVIKATKMLFQVLIIIHTFFPSGQDSEVTFAVDRLGMIQTAQTVPTELGVQFTFFAVVAGAGEVQVRNLYCISVKILIV